MGGVVWVVLFYEVEVLLFDFLQGGVAGEIEDFVGGWVCVRGPGNGWFGGVGAGGVRLCVVLSWCGCCFRRGERSRMERQSVIWDGDLNGRE